MDAEFFAPGTPALRQSVQLFWQIIRSNAGFREETILPKGVVEIIFSFRNTTSFHARIGSNVFDMPRCSINGYNTAPLSLRLAPEQTFFGVVLQPAAVQKILRVPAGEFANQCTDLTLVNASIDTLWHRLAEEETFGARVHLFCAWLESRLPQLDPREQAFNRFLAGEMDGVSSVPGLSRMLCYSPRQLSRKFSALTGMNTETAVLYKRYTQALDLVHHSPLSLTEVAYACGFADQSHFSKTFKAFTQITPSEYRAGKSAVRGHLFVGSGEDVR